ncbi:MAG: RNA polymerase sigma factor [Oligoflexia bacterium]|nr:RNA polymerase sigma factor [Oligoflexia bacterium]
MNWEQFVETYYRSIFNYCQQYLANYAEAQDVTQDVFLKCYQKRDSLRDAAAERSWVYSVARNACADKRRWYKRFATMLTGLEVEGSDLPGTGLSLTLRKLILDLPTRQREIFILRHFHDFSTADVAALMGITPGTVKTQLKRAVDKLKLQLQEPTQVPSKASYRES